MLLHVMVCKAKAMAPVTEVRGDNKQVGGIIQKGTQHATIQRFPTVSSNTMSDNAFQIPAARTLAEMLQGRRDVHLSGLIAPTMMGTNLNGCSLQPVQQVQPGVKVTERHFHGVPS